MGDMNNIMHVNEKLGPTRADVRRINTFCAYVKQCGFIDLGYNGRRIPGLINVLPLVQLMKGLIAVLEMQNGV